MNQIFDSPDANISRYASGRWYAKPIILIAAGLLLFYLLLYLLPLGYRPLVIPDETRYAEIPREMLVTGDWLVPHLNGLRYFEKPPLGYWLNAASIAVFGENEFAVRFTSALAAGLTTLLVFLFARHLTGGHRIPLLAALMHMTFLEVYLVIFLALSFISISQILQKLTVVNAGRREKGARLLRKIAVRYEIWWAVACLGIGTVFWLVVLYRMEVSQAFPFLSLGFVLVMLASRYFFREKISMSRWAGVALIIVGIFMLSRA